MEEKKTLKFYDAPVGSVVRVGKHTMIIREDGEYTFPHCGVCAFYNMNFGACDKIACLPEDRDDELFVHYEEIKATN